MPQVKRTRFVYVVAALSTDGGYEAFKIGHTERPARRLTALQTGNHRELQLEYLWRLDDCLEDTVVAFENHLIRSCRKYWLRGEWFSAADDTAVLDLVREAVACLPGHLGSVRLIDLSGVLAVHDVFDEIFGGLMAGIFYPDGAAERDAYLLAYEPSPGS